MRFQISTNIQFIIGIEQYLTHEDRLKCTSPEYPESVCISHLKELGKIMDQLLDKTANEIICSAYEGLCSQKMASQVFSGEY